MRELFIKICGVRDPQLAAEAVLAGVAWIGLVFCPQSKRHVSLELATTIAAAVQAKGGKAVAVFVDQTAIEMKKICDAANIHIIQLHGATARKQHHLLADHYQRIYVRPVNTAGTVSIDVDQGLQYCRADRDSLLFDHHLAGSGRPFDWTHFNETGPFRHGLAGGLNADNIQSAINTIKPHFVDVSSGVENSQGLKDITRIQQFVAAVRSES